jgi:hypothetical protein
MPQVVGKKEKPEQGMEWMEVGVVLAKQVLSQLSYTPFEIGSLGVYNVFMLRMLSSFRNWI